MQLVLESCVLGLIVIAFLVVGGRYKEPYSPCRSVTVLLNTQSACIGRLPIFTVCFRCIIRVRNERRVHRIEVASDIRQADELQRKMYTNLVYLFSICNMLSIHALICDSLHMYGTVIAVLFSFLLRFAFVSFNAYTYMSVSPLNTSCLYKSECDDCGDLHLRHCELMCRHHFLTRTFCRCLPMPSAIALRVEHFHATVRDFMHSLVRPRHTPVGCVGYDY